MPRTRQVLCAALAALAALALLPAAAFAGEGGVTIDPGHFPDADFRAWLTDPANLDGAGRDGVFSQAELAAVTELDVSGRQIADLTGVEHFFALETLNANNNRLTALDVSANTRLKYLYCATNALTSLEIRGCGELVDLNCERNRLTALDLSGNPKLERLYCRHNALETLDVSGNPELAFIETFDNRLLEFDGSMLKKLKFLHIDYNRLTHLDMSGNPALEGNGFVAANNWLDTLTLPDIADFQVEAAVFCEQNPRTGYDRVEWYQDAACTRPIGEEDLLPANGQTVYARWIPNPYTVYYRPNGGEGSMADQPVVYDQTFDLARNGFARAEYTFTGGDTYADAAGSRSFAAGETVRNLAGENGSRDAVYLYAQWAPNAYSIRYAGNGGTGTMADAPAVYDAPAVLAECGFSSGEGVCLGWARDPQARQPEFFAGQAVRNLTAEPGAVVTLYAVWMPNGEIQKGYQEQLDALAAQYAGSAYYPEDWTALAREKAGAVNELDRLYSELCAWEYTPENAALLEEKRQDARAGIEEADSVGMTAALLTAGKAAMEQVDPVPRTPAVSSWPTASALVQGQALGQSVLTGGGAAVPGVFAWKDPDACPRESGWFMVVFTPADSRRYQAVEQAVSLTVTKPAPAPTASSAPAPTAAPNANPAPVPTAAPNASPAPAPTAAPDGTPGPCVDRRPRRDVRPVPGGHRAARGGSGRG